MPIVAAGGRDVQSYEDGIFAEHSRAPLEPFVERYQINMLLLDRPVTQTNLAALQGSGWTLAYTDDRYLALVRSAPHARARGAGKE